MTMTALPDDWVLELGELGVDIDEDVATYLTGSRSIKFLTTGTKTRILSKIMPLSPGPTQLYSRRNFGVSLTYQSNGVYALGALRFGMRYYDVNGQYLSETLQLCVSGPANQWVSDGAILQPPANAQFGRLFIEYTSGGGIYLIIDTAMPYLMQPYGDAEIKSGSAPIALVTGTPVFVPVNLIAAIGGSSRGSHAIIDDTVTTVTAGYLEAVETGWYTIAVEAELDAFDVGDAVQLEVQGTVIGSRYGQLFAPGVASTSLSGSAAPHLAMATSIPLTAGSALSFWGYQRAGTPRNIVEMKAWLTKDT